MAYVNNDNEQYQLSVETKASGLVERNIATDVFGEYCYDSDPITHIVGNIDKTVPTYVFSVFDQTGVYYRESDAYETLGKLAESDMYVSVIADIDSAFTLGYVYDLVNSTGGEIIPVSEIAEIAPVSANMRTISVQAYAASTTTKIKAQISGIILKRIYQSEFYILSATGYQMIRLDTHLSSYSGVDTDKDTLTDWDEVDTKSDLIIKNSDGTVTLPTIDECYKFVSEKNGHLTYVEEKMKEYRSDPYLYSQYAGKYVLPILSDPTRKDTDRDGYADGPLDVLGNGKYNDPRPLIWICSKIT